MYLEASAVLIPQAKKKYLSQFEPLPCKEKESEAAKESRIRLQRRAMERERAQAKGVQEEFCQVPSSLLRVTT